MAFRHVVTKRLNKLRIVIPLNRRLVVDKFTVYVHKQKQMSSWLCKLLVNQKEIVIFNVCLPVTASRAPKHLTKDKTNAIPRYPVREKIIAKPYVRPGC